MEGGELFSRIQERADTAFTERGLFLINNNDCQPKLHITYY